MDKEKTGPEAALRVEASEDYKLRYWTEKFGVSAERLKTVQRVGVMVSDVERELRKR